MLFPKIKRFQSKENLDLIRSLPCCVCGDPPPSDPHHIKTKKSGGGDELENLLSLCRKDHQLFHTMGVKRFFSWFHELIIKHRKRYELPPLDIDRYLD